MASAASFSPDSSIPVSSCSVSSASNALISRSRSALTLSPSRANSNRVSISEVMAATIAALPDCLFQALALLHDALALLRLIPEIGIGDLDFQFLLVASCLPERQR